MKNFTPTKFVEENQYGVATLLKKNISTDDRGKLVQLVELDGESFEWPMNKATKAYDKLMEFEEGGQFAFSWFKSKDGFTPVKIDYPNDTQVLSNPRPKVERAKAVADYKSQDDERQKMIVRQSTLGYAVNWLKGEEKAETEHVFQLAKVFERYVYTGELPTKAKPLPQEGEDFPDLF